MSAQSSVDEPAVDMQGVETVLNPEKSSNHRGPRDPSVLTPGLILEMRSPLLKPEARSRHQKQHAPSKESKMLAMGRVGRLNLHYRGLADG
jgi:hypothetical protein